MYSLFLKENKKLKES